MTLQNFGYVPLRYYNLEKLLENNIRNINLYFELTDSLWRPVSDHTYPIADHFSDRIKYIII